MAAQRSSTLRRITTVAEPLVFAYGSNLLAEQMRDRCPTASMVARGRLRDHALRFAGYSSRWQGAVATAMRERGRSVRGVVYQISHAELRRLDRIEGVPFIYERRVRSIRCEDGVSRRAHVYLQPELGLELGAPSATYLRQVLGGYLDHQFDTRAVLRAIKESLS